MIIHLMNGPAIERLATKFLDDRGVENPRVIWRKFKELSGGMYGIWWGDTYIRYLRVTREDIPTYEQCEFDMSTALQKIRSIK